MPADEKVPGRSESDEVGDETDRSKYTEQGEKAEEAAFTGEGAYSGGDFAGNG